MHPLLRLASADPQLLVDHAEAYAALITADIGSTASAWKVRVLWHAAAALCLLVSLILLGVAIMLWAVTPGATQNGALVLVAVTLAPLCAAVLCAIAARRTHTTPHFDNLQQQLRADLQMLREAHA